VHVTNSGRGRSESTALRPDAARTFARGILALCDEIDGGEAKEAPLATPVKVGDRVVVTQNGMVYERDENVGREGTLLSIDHADPQQPYKVDVDGDGVWWCKEVAPVSVSAPAPSPFAAHVDEAKRLLAGTDHTGADVIVLARELHENA
jgi:hypothetical protein